MLIVSSMFPPYCGGGVSSHVRDLTASLLNEGDEITVLTSSRGLPRRRRQEEEAVPSGARVIYTKNYLAMSLRG